MERALVSSSSGKVKETWERERNFKFDKDYPYGYPWPPRHYTCSFCQREFKSAQALGGHMNIHRRDRARLRDQDQSLNNHPLLTNTSPNDQCPSPDTNPNPNPNPNPNLNSNAINISPSSSPTNNNIYAHQYSLVSLSLSSLPTSTKNGPGKPLEREFEHVFGKHKDFSILDNHHSHHEVTVLKRANTTKEIVKLDLELCLGEAKEELDLELRLGI